MIFTIGREDLAAAVTRAAAGLPAHPVLPVHAGLLLETDRDADQIILVSSDGDMMLEVRSECRTEAEGKCIVPGKLLNDISRYFSGDQVRVEYKDSELTITSGRSAFSLPARDGDEYPVWLRTQVFFTVDGEELARSLRKVAVATGENPVVQTAICLDAAADGMLNLVTTDGARMAVSTIPYSAVSQPQDVALLPGRAAEKFARNLSGVAGVGWDDGLVFIQYVMTDDTYTGGQLIARQVQGLNEQQKYPDWRKIAAKRPEHAITSGTRELIRATKMAQLASGPGDRISWTFGDHEIAVRGTMEGHECTEYVPSDLDGLGMTFLLGARLVLDGLDGCGDTVRIAFTTDRAPLFLGSGDFTYMVQPRREL